MKLTCPLLVNGIDVLEDDGFMREVNSKLAESDDADGTWMECFDGAHEAHAAARAKLIFGTESSSHSNESSNGNDADRDDERRNVLRSKLGERGASSFLDAGVAGANPSARTVDVKCLHAWFADYLFRGASAVAREEGCDGDDDDGDEAKGNRRHPIGAAIAEALKGRGIDITGTSTCHEVCSGCSRVSSPCGGENDDDNRMVSVVHVPYPTNKQRKKRPAARKSII